MDISENMLDDISVISISGRIDSLTSNELETALGAVMDKSSKIILDLANTEYISSSGLRVLLMALKMLRAKNGMLMLTSLQPIARDVFEISGLSKLFPIHANLESAIECAKSRP